MTLGIIKRVKGVSIYETVSNVVVVQDLKKDFKIKIRFSNGKTRLYDKADTIIYSIMY